MNAIAKPMTEGSAMSSDDWCTPKWLCELLGEFDLDPCGNERSRVHATRDCGPWRAKSWPGGPANQIDGLTYDWQDCSVFCNPPYSNVMPWAQKLAAHEGPWCALLKLDPSTKWWATLMSANPTFAPFKKRIKFEGEPNMTANFPSVLVYRAWEPSKALREHLWMRGWQ